MKFFILFALIALAAANSAGAPVDGGAVNTQEIEAEKVNADFARFRKSAYGGGYGAATIPAPACPKNYLFSCQPNLAAVPCAAPAASYGSQGAYSAPVPTYYAAPQGYGYPQGYPY